MSFNFDAQKIMSDNQTNDDQKAEAIRALSDRDRLPIHSNNVTPAVKEVLINHGVRVDE